MMQPLQVLPDGVSILIDKELSSLILLVVVLVMAVTPLSFARDRFRFDNDRFMVSEIDNGVLRIDRYSGVVSLCKRRSGEWVCELVADDREAMLREIKDLRRKNWRLWRHVMRFNPNYDDRGYNQVIPKFSDRDDDSAFTKKETDESMDSLEYMMERLLGAAERFGMEEPSHK
jgi:hypothetical protein